MSSQNDRNMSDEALRDMWCRAGGEFHGPNIETGAMPEADLLPLLRSLMTHHCAQLTVCGLNPYATDTGGCGAPINECADVFRCTDCGVAFHRTCAQRHFGRQHG